MTYSAFPQTAMTLPLGALTLLALGCSAVPPSICPTSLALDVSTRYNFTEIDRTRGYNPYFNGLLIGVGLLFEVL